MTTKISAIIAQQIASQTRLIIPEVGTLIRRNESGEVIFMEMLRKSDGVLASVVMQTLDVSPSKANEILNRYAATIKQQLATNKKFILDGVGVLLARPDGSIDFSFNPFSQSIPEPTRGVEVLEEEDEIITPAPKPVAPAPKLAESVVAPKPTPKPEYAPKPTERVVASKPATPSRPTIAPESQPTKQRLSLSDEAKLASAQRGSKKKIDALTIVALIAFGLAILSLIWGALPADDRIDLDVTPIEQTAE